MSSTILYKFRSGTNFESLPLPGTSARLLDIKRAIIKAEKLDRNTTTGSLDFDFAIQNANTNEEYSDDGMILPRGTRIIVRRVATERNRGLLHRMAMMAGAGGNAGGGGAPPSSSAARSDFYTIRSHDRIDEDEFVDQDAAVPQSTSAAVVDETAELEALKAVTDQAASVYGSTGGGGAGGGAGGGGNIVKSSYVAGGGGPNSRGGGGGPSQFGKPPPHSMMQQQQRAPRPNADPELRQQELPKKKTTTGIPRTFLSLNAPPPAAPTPEGDNTTTEFSTGDQPYGHNGGGEATTTGSGSGGLASQLNPNQHVFQALVNRAGGQSIGDSAGKRRDLDYALKLTATSIPEHLQCGVCYSVVKNAMLVPWDPEGRPTCESCIRDALAQNGFKCPLTGTEGVSPDDLFPNVGLRKAAELFVKDVMQQMDQIEKQIEAEEAEEEKRNALAKEKEDSNDVYEGDAGEGGTLLTRKAAKAGSSSSGKKGFDDDLFGGGDDFGGDVFDVAEDDLEEEDDTNMTDEPVTKNDDSEAPKSSRDKVVDDNNNTKTETTDATVSSATDQIEPSSNEKKSEEVGDTKKEGGPGTANTNEGPENNSEPATRTDSKEQHEKNDSSQNPSNISASTSNRRRNEGPKRRGPPAGYMLGPAGVSVGSSPNNFPPPTSVPPPPPPRGPPVMGRGPGMSDRGPPGGNFPDHHYGGGRGGGGRHGHQNFGRGHPGDWNRKRGFNQMDGGGMNQEMNQGWGGGGQRDFNYGGRGNPHYQGGGRGRFDYDGGRGGGYRGAGRGRGDFRGGRGGYNRGRGRY